MIKIVILLVIHKLVTKIFIEHQFYSKFKSHTNRLTYINPIHFIVCCDVVHIAVNLSKQKYVPLFLMVGLQNHFNHISEKVFHSVMFLYVLHYCTIVIIAQCHNFILLCNLLCVM